MSILALVEKKTELEQDPAVIEAMKIISKIDQFKVLVIKNDDQEDQYNEMFLQAKQVDKALDTRRVELVDPYNKLVKSINGYFKSIVEPVKAKMGEIENALKKWRYMKAEEARKAQERIQREQERLQVRMEKKGIDMPIPILVAPKPQTIVRTASGSTYEKREWKVKEVSDIKMLAKAVADGAIPTDALMPNMTVLNRLVKAGYREIPGVVIHEEVSLATRSA